MGGAEAVGLGVGEEGPEAVGLGAVEEGGLVAVVESLEAVPVAVGLVTVTPVPAGEIRVEAS